MAMEVEKEEPWLPSVKEFGHQEKEEKESHTTWAFGRGEEGVKERTGQVNDLRSQRSLLTQISRGGFPLRCL